MKIEQYLSTQKKRVDDWLQKYFAASSASSDSSGRAVSGWPADLREAMTYSLNAGGKRIRPILALAACEAVGGKTEGALPVACALECIHTFSLIHDDLPAMDNDDLRRGVPTNHKVFGEGMAILAGDGLLSLAFEILSEVKNAEVFRDIAIATGPEGMVGGQVFDLKAEGKKLEEKDLEKIHLYKTGRLIQVSVTSGAKIGKANAAQLEGLKKYGEKIGLAFQIADDLLNVEGDARQTGKSVGSDAAHRKATYPKVLGMEASRQKARRLYDEASSALADFGSSADPLRQIARFIVNRQS